MTYNPGIPNQNDLISQSQAEIKTNFSQADTAFGIDHTAFSVTPNQGQHKQVTVIAPIANPNQAGNLASVYTKTSGTGVELFYQHGTANLGVSQLTGGGVTAAAYCSFTVSSLGVLTLAPGSFNVSGAVRNSVGNYTISFSRNFGSTDYTSLVSLFNTVSTVLLRAETKNVGSYNFTTSALVVEQGTTKCELVFFGVLA